MKIHLHSDSLSHLVSDSLNRQDYLREDRVTDLGENFARRLTGKVRKVTFANLSVCFSG